MRRYLRNFSKNFTLLARIKDELKKEKNINGYKIHGCSRKNITNNIENELMIYIKTCRRNRISESCFQINACAIKLYGEDFKKTLNASQCWVGRF